MKKITSQEIKDFVSRRLFDEKVILKKDLFWPSISIVTPSFNQCEFLERTILSVLNQNYPNLEYIIIDGGSTDSSAEIIKKYEKYLSYWVSEKDDGQADAINKGFAKSTGEILAYLNSDDIYHPGAFLKIAKAFNHNPMTDLVFGNINYTETNDNIIGECRFTKFNFSTLIYEGGALNQPSTFWTRRIYDKVNGFNPNYRFCMDYDFFCRITSDKIITKHIRESISSFRYHKNSKSSTIEHIAAIEHERIAKKYRNNNNIIYLNVRWMLCILRRSFLFFFQGDADYVIKGIIKRILKSSMFN